jgi:hypothetical protein
VAKVLNKRHCRLGKRSLRVVGVADGQLVGYVCAFCFDLSYYGYSFSANIADMGMGVSGAIYCELMALFMSYEAYLGCRCSSWLKLY